MNKKTKTKQEWNAYMRDYHRKKRMEKIATLGGKCERCKESRIEMLSINGERILCHNCREYLQAKGRKVESK